MGRPRQFSREGVLQKALPVFWRYGFARTTLPDLERATGVNKSGLYSEFEDKEALYLACLDYYFETRQGMAILAGEPHGWDNISRFLEQAPSCDLGQNGCFSVNSLRELSGLPAAAEAKIRAGRARLAEALKANIHAADPALDADRIADQISIFFSGLCIEANLQSDRGEISRRVEGFMAMLAPRSAVCSQA
jgi:AcrR family transcriptional regulator